MRSHKRPKPAAPQVNAYCSMPSAIVPKRASRMAKSRQNPRIPNAITSARGTPTTECGECHD